VLVFSLAISLSSSSFRYTGLDKFILLGGNGTELGTGFATAFGCDTDEEFASKMKESKSELISISR
jgi:hypothetical protein